MTLWRTQEGIYLFVFPSHMMFVTHMVMEDKVVDMEDTVEMLGIENGDG
jgi:hypothetical protein